MSPEEEVIHRRFLKQYTAHEAAVRAYIRRLVPARDDANDVLQEVALVLWKKFDQLKADDDFRRWAFGVARFQVLAWRRDTARARERLILSDLTIELLADEPESVSADLDMKREMILQRCMAKLKSDQRSAIEAMYSENSDTTALAARFGRSLAGFRQWLYRIRQTLAACAEEEVKSI